MNIRIAYLIGIKTFEESKLRLVGPTVDLRNTISTLQVIYVQVKLTSWLSLRRSDGSVALLTGRVPDLSLYRLPVHLDATRGELHSDGAFTLQVELVPGEAGQIGRAHV